MIKDRQCNGQMIKDRQYQWPNDKGQTISMAK